MWRWQAAGEQHGAAHAAREKRVTGLPPRCAADQHRRGRVGPCQRGIAGANEDEAAVMEMGGKDIKPSPGVRATETALRGFWQAYRDLMGF